MQTQRATGGSNATAKYDNKSAGASVNKLLRPILYDRYTKAPQIQRIEAETEKANRTIKGSTFSP